MGVVLTRSQFEKALNNAGRSTVNKMLTQGRTLASRAIREKYAIKAGTVRDSVTLIRATNRTLAGYLIFTGRKLPLIVFGARQIRTGTSVRIKKSSGRSVVRHAFIYESTIGNVHVWTRQGPNRLPIDPLYTISIAGMFENEAADDFDKFVNEKMGPIMDNELSFYISRAAGSI